MYIYIIYISYIYIYKLYGITKIPPSRDRMRFLMGIKNGITWGLMYDNAEVSWIEFSLGNYPWRKSRRMMIMMI